MYRRIAGAAVVLACAIAAATAQAASHGYCNWDGSNSSNSAGTLCFAQGTNFLIDNSATLVFHPVNPTIFCGAHLNGVQYGSYTSGNPTCDHAYGGGNALKADEWVDISATTHGTIVW